MTEATFDVIVYGGGGFATGFAKGFTPGATMLVLDPDDGGDYSSIPEGARLEHRATMESVTVRDLKHDGTVVAERIVKSGDPIFSGYIRCEVTSVTLTDGRTFGCGLLVDCVGAINQKAYQTGRASARTKSAPPSRS